MHLLDLEYWEITVALGAHAARKPLRNSYTLRNPDASDSTDWEFGRSLLSADIKRLELLLIDTWNHAGFIAHAVHTEPFKKVLPKENFTQVYSHEAGRVIRKLPCRAKRDFQGLTLGNRGRRQVDFKHIPVRRAAGIS
jgi:hypothetical protein